MLARACTVERRIQGHMMEFRIDSFCDYCGFEPNENARRMHQVGVEKIIAKHRAGLGKK